MNYTIAPSADGTFIILKVKGEITGQTAMQFITEAHAFGREQQVRSYLVDVTQAINTDTISGNYEFAYSDMHKTEGIDQLARVAILTSPDDHSHDFIETVSTNAGFSVRIFTDPNQAHRYLVEGKDTGF
jgi:hypothetical protein